MTKRVNWLPNERVDVPDMKAGTDGFASGQDAEILNRVFAGRFSRILDGFRLAVADQIASPGQFTVFNGEAIDRSGQIVANETDIQSQRSLTLTVDGFYYIEVQFLTNPSDTGARGFWDQTAANGVEPSGDPIPPGREVLANVSTRLTPDWQIVQPVSTTGFEVRTNPNSTKIPVAIVKIAGGVVATATTAAASTVLLEKAQPGDFSLRVVDSRLLPDAFPLQLDPLNGIPEALTVTANDRDNGILTLGAAVVLGGPIGSKVIDANVTPTQFLAEKLVAGQPAPTGTLDARERMWQGDEERGFAFGRNPTTSASKGDIQIEDLKQYVNFLAAELREIKFGAQRQDDIGLKAPPFAFATPPRYYDPSGGLLGARTNTVSVGDGVNSWGDFNSSAFPGAGSPAQAALQAAHDALPASGGIIYVKGSPNPYDIGNAATVTITKNVTIIGDGPATNIRATSTQAALTVGAGVEFHLENLQVTQSGASTATFAILFNVAPSKCSIRKAVVHGLTFGVATSNCVFEHVQLIPAGGFGVPFAGIVQNAMFRRCVFIQATNAVSAVQLNSTSSNVLFEECTFSRTGTGSTACVSVSATASRIKFVHSVFTGSDASTFGISAAVGAAGIDVESCQSTCQSGLFIGDGINDCVFSDCDVAVIPQGFGIRIGPTTGSSHNTIRGCKFTQTGAPAATPARAVSLENVNACIVDGNTFIDLDVCVNLNVAGEVAISNNIARYITALRGRYGIFGAGATLRSIKVTNFDMNTLGAVFNDATANEVYGVKFTSASDGCQFHNCTFANLGHGGVINTVIGIGFTAQVQNCIISNCTFQAFHANVAGTAIDVNTAANTNNTLQVLGCSIIDINNDPGGSGDNGRSRGISLVGTPYKCIFSHNHIDGIGATTLAARHGGIVMEVSTTDPDPNLTEIHGNTITRVASANIADKTAAIMFIGGGAQVSICDNLIQPDNAVINGIFFEDTTIGRNAKFNDILIRGNTITPSLNANASHEKGIVLLMTDTPATGKWIISNNIVRSSNNIAIQASAANGAGQLNVVVSGNIIESSAAAINAITVDDTHQVAITGNDVTLTDNTNGIKRCVILNDCDRVAVTGNSFSIQNGAAVGAFVDLNLAGHDNAVCGNVFFLANNAGGPPQYVKAAGRVYVVGNVCTGAGAYAFTFGAAGGFSPSTRALKDGVTNNTPGAVVPTAFTDVGLNYVT